MADNPTTPQLAELLDRSRRAAIEGVQVSFPARVRSYNAANQTVDVEPLVKIRTSADDEPRTIPPITMCPVAFPGAGGVSIVFPIDPGDDVLVVVSSHSITEWLLSGTADLPPQSNRRHSLSDCFAIPSVRPTTNPRANAVAAGDDLVLGQEDGSFEIRITSTDIKLGDSTASSFVALADLVLSELQSIWTVLNAHVHASTGAPPTAGTPPGYDPVTAGPSSVAADKVKAT